MGVLRSPAAVVSMPQQVCGCWLSFNSSVRQSGRLCRQPDMHIMPYLMTHKIAVSPCRFAWQLLCAAGLAAQVRAVAIFAPLQLQSPHHIIAMVDARVTWHGFFRFIRQTHSK